MHRTAPRLARLLVCAAVPVMLVAGCSSDSDSGSDSEAKKKGEATASATPSPTPTVKPAKYGKLPKACEPLSKKTIGKLVPGLEDKKGKTLPTSEDAASCLWTGLEGYQYRALTVTFKRFDSDVRIGSGDKRAEEHAANEADKARVADGGKDTKSGEAAIGDSAVTIRTKTKKDDEDYRNQTVVVRTANVVVTVEYDGAGYEGSKTPDADKLLKGAEDAAKEAVEAVAAANK